MADLSPSPDLDGDLSVEPDRGVTVGTPRWVKVFGVIALVVVVVFVILLLVGGDHGPGRHASSSHTPAPASVAGPGVPQP